jgi:hypothetical protein
MPTSYSFELIEAPTAAAQAVAAAAPGTAGAVARDFRLDPTTGDLDLSGGRGLGLVRGAEAVVQSASVRLQFFSGEWFLDLGAGVPFFRDILVKNPSFPVVEAALRTALEEAPGIGEIREMFLARVTPDRELSVRWRATTSLGEFIAAIEVTP